MQRRGRRTWEGRTGCNATAGRYRKAGKPTCARAPRARAFGRDPSSRKALWPAVMRTAPTGRTHGRTDQAQQSVRSTLANGEPSTHGAPKTSAVQPCETSARRRMVDSDSPEVLGWEKSGRPARIYPPRPEALLSPHASRALGIQFAEIRLSRRRRPSASAGGCWSRGPCRRENSPPSPASSRLPPRRRHGSRPPHAWRGWFRRRAAAARPSPDCPGSSA